MNLKSIQIPSVCLISGLLLGVVIGKMLSWNQKSGEVMLENSAAADLHEAGKNPTRFSERSMRHETSPDTAEDHEDVGTVEGEEEMVWIPSSLLEELSAARGVRQLGQNLFDSDGKIERGLGITAPEKAMIQTAWKRAQWQARELETQSMDYQVSEGGTSVTITVPDLSTDLGDVGRRFTSEIRKTLGENRSEVFVAVTQVERIFSSGAGERTYQIESESTGDGRWRYHIEIAGAGGKRVWVSETVPEEISHLTDKTGIRRSFSEE